MQFEEAVRAIAAGMHHALGNALMVEVEDLFAEVEIFQQGRAARALAQRILVVGDRNALLGGEGFNIAPRGLMQFPTLGRPLCGLGFGGLDGVRSGADFRHDETRFCLCEYCPATGPLGLFSPRGCLERKGEALTR